MSLFPCSGQDLHCFYWHNYWEDNCNHQAVRGQGNAASRLWLAAPLQCSAQGEGRLIKAMISNQSWRLLKTTMLACAKPITHSSFSIWRCLECRGIFPHPVSSPLEMRAQAFFQGGPGLLQGYQTLQTGQGQPCQEFGSSEIVWLNMCLPRAAWLWSV